MGRCGRMASRHLRQGRHISETGILTPMPRPIFAPPHADRTAAPFFFIGRGVPVGAHGGCAERADDPDRPPWAQKNKTQPSTTNSSGNNTSARTFNAAGPSAGAPATAGSASSSNTGNTTGSAKPEAAQNSSNSGNNAGVAPGEPVPIVQPSLDNSSTRRSGDSQDSASRVGGFASGKSGERAGQRVGREESSGAGFEGGAFRYLKRAWNRKSRCLSRRLRSRWIWR